MNGKIDCGRIDRITDLLRRAWNLEPSFRLTQLVMVAADQLSDAGALWHITDDIIERKLEKYVAGLERRGERRAK